MPSSLFFQISCLKRIKSHVAFCRDLIIQLSNGSTTQISGILIFCLCICDLTVDLLKEVKEVKRARLTEYAAAKSTAEYHAKQNGEHGVWQYKVDLALPCARCV